MHCSIEDKKHLEMLLDSSQELDMMKARLQALPEREKLEQLKAEQIQQRNENVRTRAHGNEQQSDVFRLRQEVSKLKARERDDKRSLTATTDKEARKDLKHDLNNTQRKLADFEQRLEKATRTAEYFQEAAAEPDLFEAKIAQAKQELDRAENALQADMTAADARVQAARERISPEVLHVFDQRKAEQGMGAAWLKGQTCQGCFMELDPASLKNIRQTPADELAWCPECNVILLQPEE